MAKKFIDAEETLKRLQDLCADGNMYGDENLTLVDFAQVEETILDMPAIDVQEVKHGRWIWKDQSPDDFICVCSNCHEEEEHLYKYCPNCGARMDGEENDN